MEEAKQAAYRYATRSFMLSQTAQECVYLEKGAHEYLPSFCISVERLVLVEIGFREVKAR
jgi:hypothetical protein